MRKIFVKITLALLYVVSALPLRVHYFFSSILRFFMKKVLRYRYATIVTNLSRSFPQLKYNEIQHLTNEYYKFMCDLFVEGIWHYAHSPKTVKSHVFFDEDSVKVIDKAQEGAGRVIVAMAHCGNWEILSAFLGANSHTDENCFAKKPVYMLYKAAESKFSDMIMHQIRMSEWRKFGSVHGKLLESKEIGLHSVRHKDEQCTYVLIADQNPIGEHPMVVEFLNQPTMMLRGPEYLSARGKMAVVYLYMDLVSRGKYKVSCKLITPDASKEEPGFVTKQFAHLLESDINSNKVNWLWSHKRWKRAIPQE